jgi:hypothetical protein
MTLCSDMDKSATLSRIRVFMTARYNSKRTFSKNFFHLGEIGFACISITEMIVSQITVRYSFFLKIAKVTEDGQHAET